MKLSKLLALAVCFTVAAAATVIQIQPGPIDGEDVGVSRGGTGTESRANLNHGTSSAMATGMIGTSGQVERSLIRFDLSAITPGTTIQWARLGLTTLAPDPSSTLDVFEMLVNWREGSHSGLEPGPAADGATWQTYDGVNGWPGISGFRALDGGGYSPTSANLASPIGTGIAHSPAAGFLNWIVLDPGRVQTWADGSAVNYGLLIASRSELGGATSQVYATSDHATIAWRPILELTIMESEVPELSTLLLTSVGLVVVVIVFRRRQAGEGLAAALLLTFGAAGAFASPIYNAGNGHYYESVDTPLDWHQAHALAGHRGGYLVSITSMAENNFVTSNFVGQDRWIGLTDDLVEATFRWTSGELFGYSRWDAGEPNDSINGGGSLGEDYVVIRINAFGVARWNDIPDTLYGVSVLRGAVIEWDSDPGAVAEPGTVLYAALGLAMVGFGLLRKRTAPNLSRA